MAKEKDKIIPLNEKSELELRRIIEKYKLKETDEEAIKKIHAYKIFNENIVIQITRNLMTEKISNHEFLDALHKELKTSKEVTKSLATDIVNDLIPLLKTYTEEELKSYRSTPEPEKELAIKPVPVAPPTPAPKLPYSKKIEIPDVEDNAANMQKAEGNRLRQGSGEPQQKARTVIPQTPDASKRSEPDPYKEQLE